MEQPDQVAMRAVNELQVGTSLLQVVVVHLVARFANDVSDPGAWLRGFADEVHASIDRAAPPADAHSRWMAELLRNRLDRMMQGVQSRLDT